jgi:hypothetical protein
MRLHLAPVAISLISKVLGSILPADVFLFTRVRWPALRNLPPIGFQSPTCSA